MAKKNGTLRTLSYIAGLIVILAGIIAGYATLKANYTHTAEEVHALQPVVKDNTKFRYDAAKDIYYMKEDIGEIKTEQKEQTEMLEEIRREVRK